MIDDEAPSAASANYHAYLVRCWRDRRGAPWRASLTHVASGTVQRFASPQLAWAYLQARLEAAAEDGRAAGPEPLLSQQEDGLP